MTRHLLNAGGLDGDRGASAQGAVDATAGTVRRITRTSAVAGLGLAGLLLAACGGGGDPMVGGMTECTEPVLSEAAIGYAESLSPDNTYTLDGLTCADGWAVTTGTLGPKDPPADGPQGAPTSLIFEAEGQFWIPKEQAAVCGTYNPDDPTAYPADAIVPEALYEIGCLT
ncbi:MAG: hypothetical protein KGP10_07175 [Actinomycetales bacterium]|nr:hypothetical protein [Actinomycetales bacterium]